jgi:hypothetical protein
VDSSFALHVQAQAGQGRVDKARSSQSNEAPAHFTATRIPTGLFTAAADDWSCDISLRISSSS